MRTAIFSVLLVSACKGTLENGGGGSGGVTDPSDKTSPILTVTTPERGTMADDATVRVTGTARDESAIAGLTINGQSVAVRPDGSFTADVPLTPGLTILESRLTDRGGNRAGVAQAPRHHRDPELSRDSGNGRSVGRWLHQLRPGRNGHQRRGRQRV